MANLQIVETSLRDGNQCLWGALGVTTANTLTWAMFLLSQSATWHKRVQAEVDRELTGPVPGIADRLVARDILLARDSRLETRRQDQAARLLHRSEGRARSHHRSGHPDEHG